MSADKILSVRGLKVVACSFWQQAYTFNVLSVSVLGAEGVWWLGAEGCMVVGARCSARVCRCVFTRLFN